MEFIKKNEIIEKFDNDWSYFSIKFLNINCNKEIAEFSDRKIIESLIRSKYHFWNGEVEPNGLTIIGTKQVNNEIFENNVDGIKFCGQFDNAKIKTENYRRINFEEFKCALRSTIANNYSTEFLIKLKPQLEFIINLNCNQNDKFYLLDLNLERDIDKISKYHVFSFFVRFLSLTEENKLIKIIELGAD